MNHTEEDKRFAKAKPGMVINRPLALDFVQERSLDPVVFRVHDRHIEVAIFERKANRLAYTHLELDHPNFAALLRSFDHPGPNALRLADAMVYKFYYHNGEILYPPDWQNHPILKALVGDTYWQTHKVDRVTGKVLAQ